MKLSVKYKITKFIDMVFWRLILTFGMSYNVWMFEPLTAILVILMWYVKYLEFRRQIEKPLFLFYFNFHSALFTNYWRIHGLYTWFKWLEWLVGIDFEFENGIIQCVKECVEINRITVNEPCMCQRWQFSQRTAADPNAFFCHVHQPIRVIWIPISDRWSGKKAFYIITKQNSDLEDRKILCIQIVFNISMNRQQFISMNRQKTRIFFSITSMSLSTSI